MKNKDRILQMQEDLKNKQLDVGRKFHAGMPSVYFFIGLGAGLLFGVSSDIIYEGGQKYSGNIFEIIVLTLTAIFIIYFFWYINKSYLNPIEQLFREIKQLEKQLEKLREKSIK